MRRNLGEVRDSACSSDGSSPNLEAVSQPTLMIKNYQPAEEAEGGGRKNDRGGDLDRAEIRKGRRIPPCLRPLHASERILLHCTRQTRLCDRSGGHRRAAAAGFNTGKGKKLSNSQASSRYARCLAVA